MTKMWIIYILECGDGSLYTGITNDFEKRLAAHTDSSGAKYTKGRGPFKVLYTEAAQDRSDASRRELEIKKLGREQKRALIGQP